MGGQAKKSYQLKKRKYGYECEVKVAGIPYTASAQAPTKNDAQTKVFNLKVTMKKAITEH